MKRKVNLFNKIYVR